MDHARDGPLLLHYYVDGYGTNADVTRIIDTTELWFLPVVNVDGYDLTFQDGFRLWRKNVRDNNGDGQITGADGIDLNRNFPTSGATTTRARRTCPPARPIAANRPRPSPRRGRSWTCTSASGPRT